MAAISNCHALLFFEMCNSYCACITTTVDQLENCNFAGHGCANAIAVKVGTSLTHANRLLARQSDRDGPGQP